ncbi:hypothetical protein JCM8547_006399 [Rhodosporidiobolus lusitaniae]
MLSPAFAPPPLAPAPSSQETSALIAELTSPAAASLETQRASPNPAVREAGAENSLGEIGLVQGKEAEGVDEVLDWGRGRVGESGLTREEETGGGTGSAFPPEPIPPLEPSSHHPVFPLKDHASATRKEQPSFGGLGSRGEV